MNSAEDISKNGNYYWPAAGNNNCVNSIAHKSPKKDKKWSFGNLFRRRKKNDSESTSEDEYKKKKRSTKINSSIGFDRIVIKTKPTIENRQGILSEPDCRPMTNNFIPASEITHQSRKFKRERIKARAEARFRDNSRGEESSEEDSPFKSDESSASSNNRRTRAARTQRYLRRHSNDVENNVTKSDELWSQPCVNFSGLSTIPPSHRTTSNKASSFCDYDMKNRLPTSNNQRSVSYDANIHQTSPTNSQVIHAHLPLGFPLRMCSHRINAPPPPPPRDPNRIINVANSEIRPLSYSFNNKTNSDQLLYRLHPRINTTHSMSNDQLPQESVPFSKFVSSPSKSSDYKYLTDKQPRSRKPICVVQSNSFDFWRQKEEEKVHCKSPLIFTAKSHVTTNVFPQPENERFPQTKRIDINNTEGNNIECASPKRQVSPIKILKNELRRSTNLEEALDELEAIYKSLHLGDDELLDRATEREAAIESTSKPKMKIKPDLKSDDMAYRKFRKECNNNGSESVSPGSYLLASPVFDSNLNDFYKSHPNNEPDVTFDDVVFRNVKHTNNTLKIIEPQPPFGIPVGPILPSANSDYLHAAPVNYKRSKKIPDIVKDDLAYRNLRKDSSKEPALPQMLVSREDYLNNNAFKKKRAVRSLSANIFSLMYQKPQVFENNEQDIDDVADALQLAREILKDKEEKINATHKAFMSDGELKSSQFLNHKVQVDKHLRSGNNRLQLNTTSSKFPKSSALSNSNLSDEDVELEKALQHSTLEELLTSLARETSEHITHGLSKFDDLNCDQDQKDAESQYANDNQPHVIEIPDSKVIDSEDNQEEHDYVNIESNEDIFLISKTDDYNSSKESTNIDNVEVEHEGEKCVAVNFIALPTNGFSQVNKTSFNFDNLNCATANSTEADHTIFNEVTSSLTQLINPIALEGNKPLTTSYSFDGCDSIRLPTNTVSLSNDTTETSKLKNILTNKTESLNNNDVSIVKFNSVPHKTEIEGISQIINDFDSLQSPKLVQNLNSNCTNEKVSISNIDMSSSCSASRNNTWYDDPSVIAIACSCGIACSYQLPFDIIAVLALLFAVISTLLAIITRF